MNDPNRGRRTPRVGESDTAALAVAMPDSPRRAGGLATPLPRDTAWDGTLALPRQGYLFVANRCRRPGSDAFETRVMLHRVTRVTGEDAARMFYHPGRFTRTGAAARST